MRREPGVVALGRRADRQRSIVPSQRRHRDTRALRVAVPPCAHCPMDRSCRPDRSNSRYQDAHSYSLSVSPYFFADEATALRARLGWVASALPGRR